MQIIDGTAVVGGSGIKRPWWCSGRGWKQGRELEGEAEGGFAVMVGPCSAPVVTAHALLPWMCGVRTVGFEGKKDERKTEEKLAGRDMKNEISENLKLFFLCSEFLVFLFFDGESE